MIFRYKNMYFSSVLCLGNVGFWGWIFFFFLFLYTSYFKVLSMTVQKYVLFLMKHQTKKRSAYLKLGGVKTVLFGESVVWNICAFLSYNFYIPAQYFPRYCSSFQRKWKKYQEKLKQNKKHDAMIVYVITISHHFSLSLALLKCLVWLEFLSFVSFPQLNWIC